MGGGLNTRTRWELRAHSSRAHRLRYHSSRAHRLTSFILTSTMEEISSGEKVLVSPLNSTVCVRVGGWVSEWGVGSWACHQGCTLLVTPTLDHGLVTRAANHLEGPVCHVQLHHRVAEVAADQALGIKHRVARVHGHLEAGTCEWVCLC